VQGKCYLSSKQNQFHDVKQSKAAATFLISTEMYRYDWLVIQCYLNACWPVATVNGFNIKKGPTLYSKPNLYRYISVPITIGKIKVKIFLFWVLE
jgi:hypothetical protein